MIKKLIAAALIAAFSTAASAAWYHPGLNTFVSNVCVAPSGHYMAFNNTYGPVGAPCQFRFYNDPWVTYYGVWQ